MALKTVDRTIPDRRNGTEANTKYGMGVPKYGCVVTSNVEVGRVTAMPNITRGSFLEYAEARCILLERIPPIPVPIKAIETTKKVK